ncbi:AsmA family protein [Marixanthomonas ophiurae]|uniref:DUF748 domain-containing protein n=1 Tax=Marixanthomonas ophiurae TaxID=387659 RepID=A0A3E1QC68_9FLAO|nr:hypothetical protein [Marixanthomonas ophiurae]RFN59694.1 hypothetical protein DZ858_06470 [Marixanthomonas ophiurae]
MTKKIRLFIIVLLSVLIIFIGGIVAINYFFKNKVENFLATRLPENIIQSYDDLRLDMYEGTLTLINPTVEIQNKEDSKIHTQISVEKLIIDDISYWDYLLNDKIHIDEISINKPKVVYYKNRLKKSRDSSQSGFITMNRPVFLDRLKIEDATISIFDGKKDSLMLFTNHFSLEVDSITTNEEIIRKRLPIAFGAYKAQTDSVFVKVSDYENVTVKNMQLENKNIAISDIHLYTKYSRAKHARIIPVEKDHFDLKIDLFLVKKIDFGFQNRRLFISGDAVTLKNPYLDIFRNKLVTDDKTTKPLYSKMLRNLAFDLTLDSVKINNAGIVYTEKVKKDNKGGEINFKSLNATMSNVSNTYKAPKKTEIDIDAIFMENTPFTTNWSFDVNNTNDTFLFKANVGTLPAKDINSFTIPNLKVQLEGEANKTYFTIDGNNTTSHVDLKINYDQFKVSILNKKGDKRDGFLSAIANIFISKDSEKSNQDFRKGSGEVTRDTTKSFFNYLWLNAQKGLKSSLTGGKN